MDLYLHLENIYSKRITIVVLFVMVSETISIPLFQPIDSSATTNMSFVSLVKNIYQYQTNGCVPVIITDDRIQDYQLLKFFRNIPHIMGIPNGNHSHIPGKDVMYCRVFIVWVLSAKEFFSIVNRLKQQDMLQPSEYYILHSEESLFKDTPFHINKHWDFIRNLPNCIIAESTEIIDGNASRNKKLVQLKFDFFHSRKSFRKIGYGNRNYAIENFPEAAPNSFKGITLNVTYLEFFPCIEKYKSRNGDTIYGGSDISLMNVLSDVLNFKVHYYKPRDRKYGLMNQTTGLWNGMIAEVISGRDNIAIGCIGIYWLRFHYVDYAHITSQDCTTFVTPKAEEEPKWKVIELVFTSNVWIGIVTSLLASIFSLCILSKAAAIYFGDDVINSGIANALFANIRFLLQVASTRDPRSTSIRTFTATLWIYTLIITVAYRSMLTSLLSIPRFSKPIDTLPQLAQSDLIPNMYNYGGEWVAVFKYNSDPNYVAIWKRMQFIKSVPGAVKLVEDTRRNAVMDSKTRLTLLTTTDYTDEDTGLTTIHLMSECFEPFHIAWPVEKDSPFKPSLDKVIRALFEAGFIKKWNNDGIQRRKFSALKKREQKKMKKSNKQLSVKNLQGGFLCYLGGIISASVSFAVELLVLLVKRRRKRSENRSLKRFTKYIPSKMQSSSTQLRPENKTSITKAENDS